MSVLENSAWADDVSSSHDALIGSPVIAKIIKRLQRNNNFLEVSAVTLDWIWDQMSIHIPWKIGVDPSESILTKIGGGEVAGSDTFSDDLNVNEKDNEKNEKEKNNSGRNNIYANSTTTTDDADTEQKSVR